jgi:hypothetical protein
MMESHVVEPDNAVILKKLLEEEKLKLEIEQIKLAQLKAQREIKMLSEQKPEDFPNKIRFIGMPLSMSGWNGKFIKTAQMSDGCPIYVLPCHKYLFIDICGCRLQRNDGVWDLIRDDGEYIFSKCSSSVFPFGTWYHGKVIRC